MAGYVLDTSAVMAVLFDEDGADIVRDVVYGSERVHLPFIVLMEVEYKLLQQKPDVTEDALTILDAWPVDVVESYYGWRRRSALVKAGGKLSFADAWIASLALLADAALVHKDPEFETVDGLKQLRLPYAPSSRRGRRS